MSLDKHIYLVTQTPSRYRTLLKNCLKKKPKQSGSWSSLHNSGLADLGRSLGVHNLRDSRKGALGSQLGGACLSHGPKAQHGLLPGSRPSLPARHALSCPKPLTGPLADAGITHHSQGLEHLRVAIIRAGHSHSHSHLRSQELLARCRGCTRDSWEPVWPTDSSPHPSPAHTQDFQIIRINV